MRRLLDDMEPIDREILVLRHFEELTQCRSSGGIGFEHWRGKQTLHPSPFKTKEFGFLIHAHHTRRSRSDRNDSQRSFLDELRMGKATSVEEFQQRYPKYAASIEALFPTLLMMEDVKPDVQRLRDSADTLFDRNVTQLGRLPYHPQDRIRWDGASSTRRSKNRWTVLSLSKFLPRHYCLRLGRFDVSNKKQKRPGRCITQTSCPSLELANNGAFTTTSCS